MGDLMDKHQRLAARISAERELSKYADRLLGIIRRQAEQFRPLYEATNLTPELRAELNASLARLADKVAECGVKHRRLREKLAADLTEYLREGGGEFIN
jgi:hypothetical protein